LQDRSGLWWDAEQRPTIEHRDGGGSRREWPVSLGAPLDCRSRESALQIVPKHRYFCTFPQELISEPIISHTLGDKFGVVPNIRAASITDTMALVAVDIEGDEAAIAQSVAYLKSRGVKVEEISDQGR
jgi:hypothetical protein